MLLRLVGVGFPTGGSQVYPVRQSAVDGIPYGLSLPTERP